MASKQKTTGKSFLADLSRGGFAESLSPAQRRAIHIETDLDAFLADQVSDHGKQVILTGNPGDGKTQHIFYHQDRFAKDEYFYLLDASEYGEYRELLEEWETAYEENVPGVLAINDGPLYAMTTEFSDEYPFLQTVENQLQNQIVYDPETAPDFDDSFLRVVDLNNRNVLTPTIIGEAVDRFAEDFAREGHDHSSRCHIQYNAEKLTQREIRENLIDLLWNIGKVDVHVTVRDLINFLSFCITGGLDGCQTEFSDGLKYYNLAFEGTGLVFDLLTDHYESEQLTHPFIDSRLWALAEEAIEPRDVEDARAEVRALFEEKKRQFLFEAELMDIGYDSRTLYQTTDDEFIGHTKSNRSPEAKKERLLRLLNGYFVPGSSKRSELQLWLSHNYRSRNSLALVSRSNVSKHKFDLQTPQLHPAISNAIGYNPNHTALEYTDADQPIRVRIDKTLYQTLSALEINIPYTLRGRDNEQHILEFMESIEYHESYSEEEGAIAIKDAETGAIDEVDVSDDVYRM